MEKIGSLTTEERISSYLAGPGGSLTLTGLFQLFQESAYLHAEKLGWGYLFLAEKGLFWLLSKMKVSLSRLPHWDEVIKITTTPYTPLSLWAPRDFQVHSSQGELLVEATSHWLLVDREKLKPLPPATLFKDLDFDHPQGLCSLKIGKIRGDWDDQPLAERGVYTSHLDVNRHMNNTRYVDFISDTLTDKERESLKTLEMLYHLEAHPGDRLQIHEGKDPDGKRLLKLQRGEENILSARLDW